ncbi:protein TIFY 4B isoform X2 [Lotus japonicus]|uniref:protein TIFY 4B isoform X2 n=1 Tax=Lotus japonicus TaxID=34305 RepID=UPI002584CA47|nr:protein TIFY 4B isoform X2 [Lotus japonicus]
MNGGTTTTTTTATFRSILDKPLKHLTEDDISQLTREDCRRFLKEKGMRRPSWNKSQAIQQVISLKALLEPTDEDSPAAVHRHYHHHQQPPHASSRGRNLNEAPATAPVAEEAGFQAAAEEPQKSPSAEKLPETNDANVVSPRGCASSGSFGQMTIFYCGKVNVYDGVSPDKRHLDLQARSIMQLAASPVQCPQDDPSNKNAAVWASTCPSLMDKDALFPVDTAILQVAQTDKMVEYPLQYREKVSIPRDAEGQASRKVSVQRYLEKRKDRGRLKGKKSTSVTSSNFDMYVNLPVKGHASNGNSSRSSTSSPPQPRLPVVSGGSADNQLKVSLPIDLNDKDVQGS